MNNISDVMNSINTNELDNFFAGTKAKFLAVSDIKETKVDHTWLEVLEDTLPNLDKIVRNPRRFIIQEEDVVIVEKIKRISQETIKHLAEHSENIQDLDPNGDVVPKKLLNVHKEDTTDLYENRFIYTLVKRLESFIDRQLEHLEIVSNKEINKEVNYSAETNIDNKKINIELKLKEYDKYVTGEDAEIIKNRIMSCYDVIKSFFSTEMIKELIGCSFVSNPIRKTNLILREPNFQKAYILWDYLDQFEYKDPTVVKYDKKTDDSIDTENEYTLAYYINCNAIDEEKEKIMKYKNLEAKLDNLINEYIYEEEQNIDDFTNKTNELYNKAIKEKEERLDKITSIYNNFVNDHLSIIKIIEEC